MGRLVSSKLSKRFGTYVQVGSIDYQFPTSIVLSDIIIRDHKQKLLLRAAQIGVEYFSYSFETGAISIDKADINRLQFNLVQYHGEQKYNLDYLVAKLSGNDTTTSTQKTNLKIGKISVKSSRFILERQDKGGQEYGIDYDHMDVGIKEIAIDNLIVDGNEITAAIENIAANEVSGFVLNSFKGDVKFTPKELEVRNLAIHTPFSSVTKYIRFSYETPDDFNHFIGNVKMESNIVASRVSFHDLRYFAPQLENDNDTVNITADIFGTVDNLKVNKIKLAFGDSSNLTGRVAFRGLPEIENTHIKAHIESSYTSSSEIRKLFPETQIPSNVDEFGYTTSTCNFTGFINDFVADGKFETRLGGIVSDINLKIDEDNTKSTYSGKLALNNFNLNALTKDANLGLVTMHTTIRNGQGFTINSVKLDVEAEVSKLFYHGYTYQNAAIKGHLANKFFKGGLLTDDENLKLAFDGTVDASKKEPEFAFEAHIDKANLKMLGLTKDSFGIRTDLSFHISGIKPDDLKGRLTLQNARVETPEASYFFDSLSVTSSLGLDSFRKIVVVSDLVNGTLTGKFNPTQLPDLLKTAATNYLDATFLKMENKRLHGQYIDADIHFRDLTMIMNLLKTGISFPDTGYLKASINTSTGKVMVDGFLPEVDFGNSRIGGLTLSSKGQDTALQIFVSANSFYNADTVLLKDITLNSTLHKNQLLFHAFTQDAVEEKKLNLSGRLDVRGRKGIFTFDTSYIALGKARWDMSAEPITYFMDSIIDFPLLNFTHEDEGIKVIGSYESNGNHPIHLIADNVRLSSIHPFVPGLTDFDGEINGDFNIKNINENPYFEASLFVNPLLYLGDTLGIISATTNFNNKSKKLVVDASLMDVGMQKVLDVGGDVSFGINTITDLYARMNDCPAAVFSPFMQGNVKDISGLCNANISVKGDLDNPIVKGTVSFDDVAMRVTFLNTKYRFTHMFSIENRIINLNGLRLKDENNVEAIVSKGGYINLRDLSNITLNNIELVAPLPFLALNTKIKDNELFYGKGMVTGKIRFTGPVDNVLIAAKLTTEKGSSVSLPIGYSASYYGNDFITFKSDTSGKKKDKISTHTNAFTLDLNLNVTDKAAFEIIFDPSVGDIISGRGNGAIQMDLNQEGDFTMEGTCIIKEGKYHFTFFDFLKQINFDVKEGSKITWNGSPYDAEMDVQAAKLVKHISIKELVLDDANIDDAIKNKPVDAEALLHLSGPLLNPDIKLDFNILNLEDNPALAEKIRIIKNDDQKLNLEVASLLLYSTFTSPDNGVTGLVDVNSGAGNLQKNLSNLLSSQIGKLFSSLNSNLNVGVEAYQNSNTKMYDSRVSGSYDLKKTSISGSYDVTGVNAASYSAEVSRPLSKDGHITGKLFNHNNKYVEGTYNTSSMSTGVGITYSKEVKKFSDLFKRKKK